MIKFNKKVIVFLVTILLSLLLTGCNPIARKVGGNMTINLKPGEKLVNVTWKETSLWILTREMKANDTAETYKFREDSTFGVLEGVVTIHEYKK